MSDIVVANERAADREASKLTPTGYDLWATYVTREDALQAKRKYGHPSDKIVALPKTGRFAVFGLKQVSRGQVEEFILMCPYCLSAAPDHEDDCDRDQ